MVLICDPDGDCFEWGGYDQTTGAAAAGVDWPAGWDTGGAGTYTATLDLSGLNLSGVGTWTVSLYNGFGSSVGLEFTDVTFTVPYVCPLDGLAPGCTDEGACNFDPLADYNDGSCDYFCFTCTETLLLETFQSYDHALPLTVQATNGWETWSGPSGTAKIPLWCSTDLTVRLRSSRPRLIPFAVQRCRLPHWGHPGEYVVQFSISTEAGQTAYYNFQGEATPGIEWTLETFIDTQGDLAFVQGEDTLQSIGISGGCRQFLHPHF